jgi:hypothetical protein
MKLPGVSRVAGRIGVGPLHAYNIGEPGCTVTSLSATVYLEQALSNGDFKQRDFITVSLQTFGGIVVQKSRPHRLEACATTRRDR